ncbi:MAG: DUF262 domain-containing protein [Barnesiella sp.]|nr:DUF262 domain-containing protein [Barnesiella sp.]
MSNHKNNNIIPISDLFGENFMIPTYQRGYRWTRAQIEDLLNDLKEFAESSNNGGYYCLQPLVVREENKAYRVIDGQQRLTTIWILLLCLDNKENNRETFRLRYERNDKLSKISNIGFGDFEPYKGDLLLKNNINKKAIQKWNEYVERQFHVFSKTEGNNNVESFHLLASWLFINNWLKDNIDVVSKHLFKDICVIWHEVKGIEEEIKAFQNLNSGKIPLTNAELIKALFLSSYGVQNGGNQLRQELIAEEFDMVERQLRRDDFWYFLNERGEKPTSCISFIFNLMQELDDNRLYEGQDLRNYLFFRDKIDSLKSASKTWEQVMDIFHTLEGWYNNPEIYNLIGFLRAKNNRSIKVIYEAYLKCKTIDEFRNYLLYRCLETISWYDDKLKEHREEDFIAYLKKNFRFDENKERAWNLLLLINVLTLNLESPEGKDHKRTISKFAFSDFHNCEWNIEHISPQNPVRSSAMAFPSVDEAYLPPIGAKLRDIDDERLKNKIDPYVAVLTDSIMEISNLTFLTDHINKSIGNKNYDEKRDCVILKQSQGFYLPPSSLMIFTKGYTTRENQEKEIKDKKNNYWSDYDREAYLHKIKDILENEYLNNAKDLKETASIRIQESNTPVFNSTSGSEITSEEDVEKQSWDKLTYSALTDRTDFIIIPKIQRDYAQGRKESEDPRAAIVREKLLDDIFGMDNFGLDFQIVFGSEEIRQEITEDNKDVRVFIPIDGQQRLTTLYLLSLYRDKINGNASKVKFIYETRKAASDFCVDVVNNEWYDFPERSPKESIIASTWFQPYWLNDPTVDSILRMLDEIHKMYSKKGVFPDIEKIHFSYFDLGLSFKSDEIYLKMNTRGKELTQFENLKAAIEKEFGKNVPKIWKNKIDSIWQDMFWKEICPTRIPDSRILRIIANLLFVKLCDDTSLCDLSSLDKQSINEYKENSDLYNRLTCVLDLWSIAEKTKRNEYISTKPFIEAFKILGVHYTFDYLIAIFEGIENKFNITPYWEYSGSAILDQNYSQRAAMYGATLYFQKSKCNSGAINKDNYTEWMRFVWNISANDVEDFQSFYRACHLFDKMALKGALDDIFMVLQSEDSKQFSGTDQFKEERTKATIEKNERLLSAVKTAEKHSFFHGTIRFLFNNTQNDIWADFEAKVNNLCDLIPVNEDNRHTVEHLMEYLSDDELKDVFHKYYVNNKDNNLRDIFLYSKINDKLTLFFKQSTVTEPLTTLQQQLIALAPRHRDYYIINNWRGAHGLYTCVLTKTSTQSWHFATRCFSLDDKIYINLEKFLKEEPFMPEIDDWFKEDAYLVGVEINFKYRTQKFRYYNQDHTIRLMGSQDNKLYDNIENVTYIGVAEDETKETLTKKLDKLVEYSETLKSQYLSRIFNFIDSLGENPVIVGFDSDLKTDVETAITKITTYNWVSIEVIRKNFGIAFTIDNHHKVEIGLRLLPGENTKKSVSIHQPNTVKSYSNKNHYWFYVYSENQFNQEVIETELESLLNQYTE